MSFDHSRSPSNIDRKIGRNLKKLRMLSGMTQAEAASAIGVTFQQVQKYESGANRLPLAALLRLKALYGVPYDLFFDGTTDQSPGTTPPLHFDEQVTKTCRRLAAVRDVDLRRKIFRIIEVLDS
jgi:transcriptional regulator with XRE-family HTH domain